MGYFSYINEKSKILFTCLLRERVSYSFPVFLLYYLITDTKKILSALSAADVGALPVDGTAASATKLETARSIITNLSSSFSASFNGTANITPGI